ncbi:RagB/SusD family nutrient uptake outer membrane protein [Kaistella jeonii]|uniref:Glycan metabolism protein RagB n=1 Tax=Kaistella jeonii TaxID=266749 RepID=A0A0C1F5L2_9FLAO|nr:RagB/SusD family nutrient uptake outer membrane protein [Kaistella jeonii]KIA88502.1 glycan metabolism protein RagB [Kaistella jeonii]SFC19461.1 SusD family protein [Kaistella jeonii]VEI97031.1 SusD family [Kaistella jeonii]
MKIQYHVFYTLTMAALLALSLQSCENLLEVDAPIDQIGTGQVFESVGTADAALSHLYTEVQAYSLFSGSAAGAGALLGTYTDELISYDVYTQNGDMDLYHNVQGSSNRSIKAVWTNAYSEIYTANALLEGIEKSQAIPEVDKKRIKGEALVVRSLIYFYLNQLFGDIPYPITTDYMVNKSIAKTASQEVLLKIENDVREAVGLLSDEYRNTERIYPNRKTAEMILATVLMTRHQYPEAEELLRGVVQFPLYQWEPDVTKTFKKSGSHILWQLKPLHPNDATNEVLLYYFESALPNNYALSDELVASFTPDDLRKQQWVKEVTIGQQNYYRADKYKNMVENSDEYSIVFRLEEVYLLLAEALVQQNKRSEALPYLNAVKQKAGIAQAPPTATKEELLQEILDENRKEFFTERGIRFITLKRANRLNELTLTKPQWNQHHQLWPLPFSELILNPNLNPQNNGY